MSDVTFVKSPCISICVLSEDNICDGCYRSSQEITDWSAMSEPAKAQVMEVVRIRLKQMNKHLLL
ncbi:MAG: putative Fe-S protein YdhL (DUF1289 family) [Oceanicoccus sp.]|jgi:predicted Fe-S protein YdhL (DUF1289 family)